MAERRQEMSDNKKDEPKTPDSSFDQDQQHMFGNENQSAVDATRPPSGTQADPVLPGIPTPETEHAVEELPTE
jgi:hypothetical protein